MVTIYTRIQALVGRDRAVGIATRYGLDGPGIESRCGARFSVLVQTVPGAHPASYTMGARSFQYVKRPVRGVDQPPSPSADNRAISLLNIWACVARFIYT
jgi:hypothetical protein